MSDIFPQTLFLDHKIIQLLFPCYCFSVHLAKHSSNILFVCDSFLPQKSKWSWSCAPVYLFCFLFFPWIKVLVNFTQPLIVRCTRGTILYCCRFKITEHTISHAWPLGGKQKKSWPRLWKKSRCYDQYPWKWSPKELILTVTNQLHQESE